MTLIIIPVLTDTILNQNLYIVIFISITLEHQYISHLFNLDFFKLDIK